MKILASLAAVLAIVPVPVTRAAVVPAAGYAVHAVPVAGPVACASPGAVQGGVVRLGHVTLVGWGNFGAGCESVLRVDGGGVATIATGFNSLGGFDLDRTGRLVVVDNGGDQSGAATGDTAFAIPDPFTRTAALPAAGAELAPAGAVPSAFDVLALRDGSVLATDAAGVGIGRVVRIAKGVATTLITGLDYAAGLAVGPGRALLVGNVDGSFAGSVTRYSLRGKLAGTVASGLPGDYAQAFDADGKLLVTAASKVVAIGRDGSVTDRATGFGFVGDVFFDPARDEALVLDFGATAITTLCRDRDGDGVCDVDDDCPTAADGAQTDTDGDGLGDACECSGPTLTRAHLALRKLAAPAGDDTLSASAVLVPPGAVDPVTSGLRLIVRNAAGNVLNATIPGGAYDTDTKTGWRATRSGFAYTNGLGGVLGITKAVVRVAGGAVKVAVKGVKGSYAPATPPLTMTIVLDGAAGECGAVSFAGCTAEDDKVACSSR